MTTDYSQSHEQTTDFDKGIQYEEQEEYFGEHSTDSNPTTPIDLTTDYSLDKQFSPHLDKRKGTTKKRITKSTTKKIITKSTTTQSTPNFTNMTTHANNSSSPKSTTNTVTNQTIVSSTESSTELPITEPPTDTSTDSPTEEPIEPPTEPPTTQTRAQLCNVRQRALGHPLRRQAFPVLPRGESLHRVHGPQTHRRRPQETHRFGVRSSGPTTGCSSGSYLGR